MNGNERDAFSPEEFARRFGFTRQFLYKLWSQGQGPSFFRVGRKVLISREAADNWRREMEARTAV